MSGDGSQNFGDTLSGGIQDVSALLPLLGTEQCERHVGTALEQGFLYAAAAPLSIFGSLGIVKTGFSTLLATTTHPFRGASWLADAGFTSSGSVSSLVTMDKLTREYGAEVYLRRLLEDQHIDNSELVSKITVEWSDWRPNARTPIPWNVSLILASALTSIISYTPYLYLAIHKRHDPLAWLFPAFRSFGSFLCVVTIQLALQLRILRIVRSRLLLMKFQSRYSDIPTGQGCDLESSIQAYFPNCLPSLPFGHLSCCLDRERHPTTSDEDMKKMEEEAASLLAVDWALFLYQVFMTVGMAMVVVGYVGCFSLVGGSGIPKDGPYVWVGLEAFLSLVRMSLWGLNPTWDDCGGVKLSLGLCPKNALLPDAPQVGNDEVVKPDFPSITTTYQHCGRMTFVAQPEEEFLRAATLFTGPLPRFQSGYISLLYVILPSEGGDSKALCTVVVLAHSQASICLVFDQGPTTPRIISSHSEVLPQTTARLVSLGKLIQRHEVSLSNELYDGICRHSYQVAVRLFGSPHHTLPLSWNLTLPNSLQSGSVMLLLEPGHGGIAPLTLYDKEYIKIQGHWLVKTNLMKARQRVSQDMWEYRTAAFHHNLDMDFISGGYPSQSYSLQVYLLETYLLELFLYKEVWDLATQQKSSRYLLDCLTLEWMVGMHERMTSEKEHIKGWIDSERQPLLMSQVMEAWEKLLLDLQRLSQSGDALSQVTDFIRQSEVPCPIQQMSIPTPLKFLYDICTSIGEQSKIHPDFSLDLKMTLYRLHLLLILGFGDMSSEGYAIPALQFLQPFLRITPTVGTVGDYIHGITWGNIVSVLQLQVSEKQDTAAVADFLCQLASLPDTIDTLTTLVVPALLNLPNLTNPLSEILQKHINIVSVISPPFDKMDAQLTKVRDCLLDNRRRWWQNKRYSSEFEYLVGFETFDAVGSAPDDTSHIHLTEEMKLEESRLELATGNWASWLNGCVESLILVHSPSPGLVTFSFERSSYHYYLKTRASVRIRSTSDILPMSKWTYYSPKAPQETSLRPVSTKFRFTIELGQGNHEVRVQLFEDRSNQYISVSHPVQVEFAAIGEVSDAEILHAMGA